MSSSNFAIFRIRSNLIRAINREVGDLLIPCDIIHFHLVCDHNMLANARYSIAPGHETHSINNAIQLLLVNQFINGSAHSSTFPAC